MSKAKKAEDMEGAKNLKVSGDLRKHLVSKKILLVMLLLIGGGAAAYFLIFNNKEQDGSQAQQTSIVSCEEHALSETMSEVINNSPDVDIEKLSTLEADIEKVENFATKPECVSLLVYINVYNGDTEQARMYIDSYKNFKDAPPLYEWVEGRLGAQEQFQKDAENNKQIIYGPQDESIYTEQ